MKLKYNASNVCDDESLESEKGLGKTNKQKKKKTHRLRKAKLSKGITGMPLPRRRGKGEPGRAQGESPPPPLDQKQLGEAG